MVFTNSCETNNGWDRESVEKKNGTTYNVENLKKVSRDKKVLMFWGAIRFDGCKMLIKWSNNMKCDEYLKVLQKYQENLHFDALVYQQDNAPFHKAKKIMVYFADDIWKILDWPAYSPDLNPFESLWANIRKRLHKETVSWENLEVKIPDVWNNIDQETVAKLYESMESKIEKVSRVKSAPI